ncbi:MAG: twin-arginine translocase TatA/TatE family subunit [Bdellovibrionales bacterium]
MGIGIWQIIVILLIVLIVFGAGRLPQVMGDLGKGIKSFKEGLNGKNQDEKDAPLLSQDEDKD